MKIQPYLLNLLNLYLQALRKMADSCQADHVLCSELHYAADRVHNALTRAESLQFEELVQADLEAALHDQEGER